MQTTQLLLASQSPRRKELLKQIGIEPLCRPVDLDESILPNEKPLDYCCRLALEKAKKGWENSNKTLFSLGSDTIVVNNKEILGKPQDENNALSMLLSLSNKTHYVITAVALVSDNKSKVVSSTSHVIFTTINEQDALNYIATKVPMDKAGSYGIQGYAAKWIKHISGSHSGIMGLPLYETAKLIEEFNTVT